MTWGLWGYDSTTASRTAMPAWYHNTHNPNFRLDPTHEPSTMWDEDDPNYGKPGVFVSQNPDGWSLDGDGEPYGYRVEFDGPENMSDVPGTVDESFGGDSTFWVPADQYHHLRQQQIIRNPKQLGSLYDDHHTASRIAMPWYHNTDAELNPGDELLPASQRGHESEWGSQSTNAETGQSTPLYPHYDPHSVYLYNEHGDPSDYEDFGQHRYEVEPIGQTRPDPEHESMRQQALEELAEVHGVSLDEAKGLLHEDDIGGMHSYVAPRARVVKKLNQKEAHLMTAAITVYTQPSCIQCTMTKKQLDKLGIDHDTVDVSTDPDAHAYVTGLGYTSAPVVVVGDGEDHWAGFKPDRLRGLVE